MYQKPRVERFGSFRELTRVGFSGSSDGFTVTNNSNGDTSSGCDLWGTCSSGSRS
jgi:hypothetical protein